MELGSFFLDFVAFFFIHRVIYLADLSAGFITKKNPKFIIFLKIFLKHRPSGPMLSISRNVRLPVCPCVCSLLSCRLNVFLPPLPKVGCPIFLEIRHPWGKIMERSGVSFEHFVGKLSKIAAQKKSFFCWFCLTKHGGNHASRWIRDLWSKGVSLILAYL